MIENFELSERCLLTSFKNCSRWRFQFTARELELAGKLLGVNETKFIEIFDNIFLEKINNIPTRENNVLGLLITSIPDKIKISEVLKPTDVGIFTDHRLIMFDLITACNPLTKRSVFNYRRADFDGLQAHFRSLKFEEKITEHGDISKDWLDWKDSFLAAVKHFVPTVNLKGRRSLPWLNSTILQLIMKKTR